MNETIEDILREMEETARMYLSGGNDSTSVFEILSTYHDRIEAAHVHDVNHMLKIDNACVAQCAVLLDDHIKAIVAEVKRRANNGNR